ncbi:gamma-glutamylcyclotransferase family protein [Vibrio sp. LaRot3]|uniref:gamma-glutamylcyclotransferase family protein n=1 Tax=Vibrio sp. LaRot3 TaxID=2998829 RepID=UPI0022CE0C7E|nr:gamma-glutamylcyclotransferase family protein [Vibrio sp. LaRot3]MDA0148809.1 gamma-glutamylcyclotransferase [Vibrio sp. LaRot3]
MADYIFGYGSLMNSASRQLTGQTSQATPAVVHGLCRHWSKVDDSYVLAPLVVTKGKGLVNGMLLQVNEQAIAEFDIRERGYQRISLPIEQIDVSLSLSQQDKVWVYITEQAEPPCLNSPIMQTYVDTVMAGCLEVSEAFAQQFIEHTVGWHHAQENDRHQPKYGNLAGVTTDHQQVIDKMLKQLLA